MIPRAIVLLVPAATANSAISSGSAVVVSRGMRQNFIITPAAAGGRSLCWIRVGGIMLGLEKEGAGRFEILGFSQPQEPGE